MFDVFQDSTTCCRTLECEIDMHEYNKEATCKKETTHLHTFVNDFVFSVTEFQNYLRTQAGNNTTVNIVISTVDYLLRLQVISKP